MYEIIYIYIRVHPCSSYPLFVFPLSSIDVMSFQSFVLSHLVSSLTQLLEIKENLKHYYLHRVASQKIEPSNSPLFYTIWFYFYPFGCFYNNQFIVTHFVNEVNPTKNHPRGWNDHQMVRYLDGFLALIIWWWNPWNKGTPKFMDFLL